MSRVKLANLIVKRNSARFYRMRGVIIDVLAAIEEIAIDEMITNMDGESEALQLMAARARAKAIKRLNKLVPSHPSSLVKSWGKRQR